MKPIKRILVPTDFSDDANEACVHAQQIAEMYGAKIDLLHVIPLIHYFNESLQRLGTPFDMEKDIYPKVRKESEKRLQNKMNDLLYEVNRGSFFVKIDRKPSNVIMDHAKEGDYDLIVIGAKGSHKTELLKGTITEKVIRRSEVPVYVVPSGASTENIKNIMVPTDISDISIQALPVAAQLARHLDAGIMLFHVLELYGTLSENIPRELGTTEELAIYQKLLESIDQMLKENYEDKLTLEHGSEPFGDYLVLNEGSQTTRIPIGTVIKKGINAHYQIENYVPGNADMLVMSTHGHSGLAHFFLGSTTEQVAQHVNIPTITIRPDKKQLKEKAEYKAQTEQSTS